MRTQLHKIPSVVTLAAVAGVVRGSRDDFDLPKLRNLTAIGLKNRGSVLVCSSLSLLIQTGRPGGLPPRDLLNCTPLLQNDSEQVRHGGQQSVFGSRSGRFQWPRGRWTL